MTYRLGVDIFPTFNSPWIMGSRQVKDVQLNRSSIDRHQFFIKLRQVIMCHGIFFFCTDGAFFGIDAGYFRLAWKKYIVDILRYTSLSQKWSSLPVICFLNSGPLKALISKWYQIDPKWFEINLELCIQILQRCPVPQTKN